MIIDSVGCAVCRLSGCISISAGISCVPRNPEAGILLNINSTSNTTAGPGHGEAWQLSSRDKHSPDTRYTCHHVPTHTRENGNNRVSEILIVFINKDQIRWMTIVVGDRNFK